VTRAETRCGCFLPDLTGLARRPSTAGLPTPHIMLCRLGRKSAMAGGVRSPESLNRALKNKMLD